MCHGPCRVCSHVTVAWTWEVAMVQSERRRRDTVPLLAGSCHAFDSMVRSERASEAMGGGGSFSFALSSAEPFFGRQRCRRACIRGDSREGGGKTAMRVGTRGQGQRKLWCWSSRLP